MVKTIRKTLGFNRKLILRMFQLLLLGTAVGPLLWLPMSCSPGVKTRQVEPSAIYIRNSTDSFIDSIKITGLSSRRGFQAVGSIAPLPARNTQVVLRPANPEKLPRTLRICWHRSGEEVCQEKNITDLLKGLNAFDKAIVFDIQPPSTLSIYLEPL